MVHYLADGPHHSPNRQRLSHPSLNPFPIHHSFIYAVVRCLNKIGHIYEAIRLRFFGVLPTRHVARVFVKLTSLFDFPNSLIMPCPTYQPQVFYPRDSQHYPTTLHQRRVCIYCQVSLEFYVFVPYLISKRLLSPFQCPNWVLLRHYPTPG